MTTGSSIFHQSFEVSQHHPTPCPADCDVSAALGRQETNQVPGVDGVPPHAQRASRWTQWGMRSSKPRGSQYGSCCGILCRVRPMLHPRYEDRDRYTITHLGERIDHSTRRCGSRRVRALLLFEAQGGATKTPAAAAGRGRRNDSNALDAWTSNSRALLGAARCPQSGGYLRPNVPIVPVRVPALASTPRIVWGGVGRCHPRIQPRWTIREPSPTARRSTSPLTPADSSDHLSSRWPSFPTSI